VLAASVGTGVALDVSVAGAVFEVSGEAVLVGVDSAVGLDGCASCGLQPANPTIIKSATSIRNKVFIRASIFDPQVSLTCSVFGKVLWLEAEVTTETHHTFVLTSSHGNRCADHTLGYRRIPPHARPKDRVAGFT
jgi:hypothetical protein